MQLLLKARLMLRRCESHRTRSAANIEALQFKMQGLKDEIRTLDSQQQVYLMMSQQQIANGVTTRSGLFAMQQHSAVYRQKIQELALQRRELEEQTEQLQKQLTTARSAHMQWHRKVDKFFQCVRRERIKLALQRSWREETEVQEKYSRKF
ncbi:MULTISPECIES: hypothetical protein [unclassified Undibacterium]|uniref:hypothetical protein n=1 Tax=unclassified Undibacterium TaxID=2630295 RepID=UPI002AC89CFF|nr:MULTISPECIES: hypothetical protein [unclassified Undibacterium]MEB0140391.1 hypothetical protein [Undibacterium sp. CCC2.1]MEB0173425.1 hypothetical protein [Undibacterium sp. CCC1.1]MEB0177325.1 hypothetical protein [Undibacterium sp. CCC3.4]MEB0216582.1 hypothetical protein [Undibacterium sp. 5I2]WPX43484.1 hypothetical protein RHM61_19265 [Undibacterium sp. CCC3.4]